MIKKVVLCEEEGVYYLCEDRSQWSVVSGQWSVDRGQKTEDSD